VSRCRLAEELAQDALSRAPAAGRNRASRTTGAVLNGHCEAPCDLTPSAETQTALKRKHEEFVASSKPAGDGCAADFNARSTITSATTSCASCSSPVIRSLDRGARCAHVMLARRSDDRRDRACLPRPGAHHRPANRPSQADSGWRRMSFRGPPRGELAARSVLGARSHLPRLQRSYSATSGGDWCGLHSLRGDALASRAYPAGAASQEPKFTAWRAHGDPSVALGGRA